MARCAERIGGRVIRICAPADSHPGESMRVTTHVPIAVLTVDGVLLAIDDTCTYQDASLSQGWLEGCSIECPLHSTQASAPAGT
ncbi:Rieske 2Fe-2S domain-containing protein [Actinoplanes sp. URMC 104]|uniref:Rieske 2Fe-2S domain-containing protein n=1 Tax=Actinoplanes sp. URMC 104 TaxID=3423409 RepID=UPI003F1E2A06